MSSRRKQAAVAVTLGVWIAAMGLAAALIYDLDRPLRGAISAEIPAVRSVTAGGHDPPQTSETTWQPGVVAAPSAARSEEVREPAQEPETVGFAKMRCTDWRTPDSRSGSARFCE
jgi:hypothetical protein